MKLLVTNKDILARIVNREAFTTHISTEVGIPVAHAEEHARCEACHTYACYNVYSYNVCIFSQCSACGHETLDEKKYSSTTTRLQGKVNLARYYQQNPEAWQAYNRPIREYING